MPITAVLGEQRGDEGKGRFVDMLSAEHDIVARFNGGHNAGHTIVLPDERVLKLHLLPSGIAYEHTKNVIGNGTFVHPVKLIEEIDKAAGQGIQVDVSRLMISSAAHLILPHHVSKDEIREAGVGKQGTTKCGIAPVGSAKGERIGFQVGNIHSDLGGLLSVAYKSLKAHRAARDELGLDPIYEIEEIEKYHEAAISIGKFVTDTVVYLNGELAKPQPARVLAEGAQAFLLDIDHGMYPFVTSSSTTTGGILTGLGVGPKFIERVIGVSKAIPSHVGDGPFVTEIHDPELLDRLHGDMGAVDAERGTTTGRVRRLGYLDLPGIKRANMINGTDEIAVTKLDWVPRYGPEAPVCVGYVNGREFTTIAPASAHELEQWKPVLIMAKTWEEDISGIREYEDLPKEAKRFIEIIEENTKKPVTMIGVGPGREQVIIKNP